MKPELRFNYTGSYRDPKRHHFGCGDWLSEADCRQALAANLRSADVAGESLRVIVQQKKSRWLHFKNGTVAEIFPDLIVELERERAVAEIVGNTALPVSVGLDAQSAVRRGAVDAELARAEALAAVLRQVVATRSTTDAELLARWTARNPPEAH